MDKDEANRISYELHKEIKLLLDALSSVLNKNAPVENLVKAVENFKKKRQLFNNLDIGLIIGFKGIILVPFKLTGNIEKDNGQKNLSKENPDDPII